MSRDIDAAAPADSPGLDPSTPGEGGHLLRDRVLLLGVAVLASVLIWLAPWVGFPLGVIVSCAVLPYGTTLQDRAAVMLILLVAAVAVAVGLASAPASAATIQAIVTCLVLAATVANLAWSPSRARYPRVDWVTALVGLAVASVGWSILRPFRGATDAQVLSGLIGGWDHSSHFAMFAGIHQQEVVDFIAHDSSGAMFSEYPSTHAQLWAMLTSALLGGPDSVTRTQLLVPYTVMTAATVAISCGLLVGVAADIARHVTGARSTTGAAAAAAFTCWLMVLLGGVTYFFNAGHVNFLLAVTIAVGATWYAVRPVAGGRWWGPALLVLGALAVAALYVPVVVGFILAGAVVARGMLGRARLGLPIAVVGAVAAGALLLRLAGFDPADVMTQVSGLVIWTGGYPPLNAALAVVAPMAVAALLAEARSGRTRLVLGAVSASTGLTLAVAVFVCFSIAKNVPLHTSYYTMKLAGGLAVSASVLVAVLIGLWFGAYIDHLVRDGTWRGWARSALAWVGLTAVLVSSMGYFGPGGAYLPSGSALAPGWSAFREREWLVNDVPEGGLILSAHTALTGRDAMPILWDGGELKNNVWLSTLQWQLSSAEHALLSSLGAPFGEAAADSLRAWLTADESRMLQLAYFRDESLPILEDLAEEFPDRVVLSKM